MSFAFDGKRGLVLVGAEVTGPAGIAVLRLALDTGATKTMINTAMLVAVGYDPAVAPERVEVTTGSAVEFAPLISISKLVSLGQERSDFSVLAHTLPPSAGVDGVLGLDFLRGQVLTINFRSGKLAFAEPADVPD
jgi:predicted aspartyl protease